MFQNHHPFNPAKEFLHGDDITLVLVIFTYSYGVCLLLRALHTFTGSSYEGCCTVIPCLSIRSWSINIINSPHRSPLVPLPCPIPSFAPRNAILVHQHQQSHPANTHPPKALLVHLQGPESQPVPLPPYRLHPQHESSPQSLTLSSAFFLPPVTGFREMKNSLFSNYSFPREKRGIGRHWRHQSWLHQLCHDGWEKTRDEGKLERIAITLFGGRETSFLSLWLFS